jgi:hypothetical protein
MERLPEQLALLLRQFRAQWGLPTDAQRVEKRLSSSMREIDEFYEGVYLTCVTFWTF